MSNHSQNKNINRKRRSGGWKGSLIVFAVLLVAVLVYGLVNHFAGQGNKKTSSDSGYEFYENSASNSAKGSSSEGDSSNEGIILSLPDAFDQEDIPEYSGELSVAINGDEPYFTEDDITTEVFELYSDLDELGRCGTAYANICIELMPTEKRGDISSVHPSGWHSGNDPASWSRSHLIAYMLAGENANEKNLITGTYQFNAEGMLPYESMVDEYVEKNNAHVLYRVTPIFEGDNLIADGVLMEAYSVEDDGKEVCYCVFVYNVADGVGIDYATGESWYE